jgi:hypothetical protein
MDGLNCDLWSEVCLYLDVFSLVNFERSHKSCATALAWLRLLETRFQLSLVNRPYLTANPRHAVQLLANSTDWRMFKLETWELLAQSNAWRKEVQQLTVQIGKSPFGGATELAHATPLSFAGDQIDVYAEPLVQQWLRLRELAQRGVVCHAATLAKLSVGDQFVHYVCKRFGHSPSGLRQLSQFGAGIKWAVSRVDAVCNGVVQFREFSGLDEHGVSHFNGVIGWAMRCDMLVLSVF